MIACFSIVRQIKLNLKTDFLSDKFYDKSQ